MNPNLYFPAAIETMRKYYLVLFCLLFCLTTTCRAEQVGTPVVYSKSMPKQVRQSAVRGAKSIFYGFVALSDKSKILLHLYNVPGKSNRGKTGKVSRIMEVFQQRSRSIERTARNSKTDSLWEGRISVRLVWVDPKTKRIPAFTIDQCDPELFYGPAGSLSLAYFPDGWHKPPTINGYYYGGDHNESNSVSFRELDERGLMIISLRYQTSAGVGNRDTTLYWNGHAFEPRAEATPTPAPESPE